MMKAHSAWCGFCKKRFKANQVQQHFAFHMDRGDYDENKRIKNIKLFQTKAKA